MALLNDLKKLLFGAKAVTQSAADKAVEAGKEAGNDLVQSGGELWEKAKAAAQDLGNTVSEKAEQAMDKVADLTDGIGSKTPAHSVATPSTAAPSKPDTDDIMADIMAERQASENARPALADDEEVLELPPLRAAPDAPKLLDDGKADEPALPDPLEGAATATGNAVLEKSGEALGKASNFVEGVGKKLLDTGGEWTDKLGHKAADIGSVVLDKGEQALEKAAGLTEEVGKKVLDAGGRFTEKFGETAENVGEALFEKGGEALERAKGLATDIGTKIWQAKDDLMAKAQAEAAKEGDAADSLADKLKGLNQKLEDKISGNNQPFADKTLHTGGSEFAKHDSFWEKADRFAKGDYHNQGGRLKPGELKLQDDPDFKSGTTKAGKDGEDLIDDAIVEG